MALGTITSVPIDPHSQSQAIPVAIGDLKTTVTTVVGESSYTTGGTALTPAQLGLSTVVFANVNIASSTGTATSYSEATYNAATGKLQMFLNTGAEAGSAANFSSLTLAIQAFGY